MNTLGDTILLLLLGITSGIAVVFIYDALKQAMGGFP